MVVSLQNSNNNIHNCMFNSFILIKKNLINNIKQAKLKNPNSKICAMVKADAYGVGAESVVKLLDNYTDFFGVACFFEAKKIKNYITKPILIVGPLEKNNVDLKFSYTCSCLEDVTYLKSLNKEVKVHLKVNTGMNRFGFRALENFKKALNEIKVSKLKLEGVFTHFATSDEYVEIQMLQFQKFIDATKQMFKNVIIHADNSVTSLKFNHNLDMIRMGYNLFISDENNFKPVVNIKSKIVSINNVKSGELIGYNYKCIALKDIKVGIVPVGYADGFSVKNIGLKLVVNNKECEVLNVCMDCFMIDLSDVDIKKGTNIFILNNVNSLKVYSNYLKISEYEVMCNFSKIRASRIEV